MTIKIHLDGHEYVIRDRNGRKAQVSVDGGAWKSTGYDKAYKYEAVLKQGATPTLRDFSMNYYTRTDIYSYTYQKKARGIEYTIGTMDAKMKRMENHILPRFGDYKLKDIKAREIEAWFISLDSVKIDNHHLSNGTKNCILSTLREVLDDAVKEGLVDSNEARKVRSMPKRIKKKGSLSKSDLDKLFPKDDSELESIYCSRQMAMFFLIFLDTGFRPCEILALRYEQIRPDRTVYTEYMYEQETKKVVHRLKTSSYGKKYKVGVLSERTVNYIGEGRGYIFDLNTMNQVNTYRMFKRVVKKVLDRNDVTQYTLRHAFMTNLKYKYPKELIMELMGHTTWEDCYDDSTPEMIMDNVRTALTLNQA